MGHRSNAMNELSARFERLEHTGRLGESFTKITSAIRSLEQLNSARDLTQTNEAHTARVGKAAQLLQQRLGSLKDQALAAYSTESGRISGEIVTRLNLRPNRFESELRAVLLQMPSHAERIEWLQTAAKDPANGPLLAAVLEAPPALTGISTDAIRAVEQAFIEAHAPDLLAMQQDLDDALSILSASHRTAEGMSREYQDVKALERIAQTEAAALEAQQRMAEALS